MYSYGMIELGGVGVGVYLGSIGGVGGKREPTRISFMSPSYNLYSFLN